MPALLFLEFLAIRVCFPKFNLITVYLHTTHPISVLTADHSMLLRRKQPSILNQFEAKEKNYFGNFLKRPVTIFNYHGRSILCIVLPENHDS